MYYNNKTFYIKISVNNQFNLRMILCILDINLNFKA